MAKRKSTSRRAGRPASTRAPKKATEVEVVEEEGGGSWETAVAVLTGVILLIACLVVDFGLGHYDSGLLF